MKSFVLAMTPIAALAIPAQAATIVNGSFEDGGSFSGFRTFNGPANTASIQGWTIDGSVDHIGDYWSAQQGTNSVDLAGTGNGSLSQAIATVIGQRYDVSFWIGRNPDSGLNPRTGFVDIGGAQTLLTYSGGASTRSNMLWQQEIFSFTATTASTTLRFSSDPATSQGNFGLALDNVSIAAVPEPATWAMMILGFGLIGGALRRKPRVGVSFA